MENKENKLLKIFSAFVSFIGMICLLTGIYGSTRVAINVALFKDYPLNGAFTFFNPFGYYPQKESDCLNPQSYYTLDGSKLREPTKEELVREKDTQQICLRGVKDSRETAKQNDIGASLFFLFLGAGLLATKRFYLKD